MFLKVFFRQQNIAKQNSHAIDENLIKVHLFNERVSEGIRREMEVEDDEERAFKHSTLRCSYNGQPLQFSRVLVFSSTVFFKSTVFSRVQFSSLCNKSMEMKPFASFPKRTRRRHLLCRCLLWCRGHLWISSNASCY